MSIALTHQNVHAQDNLGVQIQPSVINERVDPGTVITGTLTVTHRAGGRQRYYVSSREILSMNNEGTPTFADAVDVNDPLAITSWIMFDRSSVELDEEESAQVPYRIVVPEDASPGSYYAGLFVTREANTPEQTGAGVGFHVASLLSVWVNGEVSHDLAINSFATDRMWYTSPEVTFAVQLENRGTVHERPQGIVTINNMRGTKVGQLMINSGDSPGGIMPRNTRTFSESWIDDSFMIGKYTAVGSFVFGDREKQTVTRSMSFWIIPVREIGIALVALFMCAFVITLAMRRYVRRELAKAGHVGAAKSNRARAQVSFIRRLVRTFFWLIALLVMLFIATLVFFA